MTTTDETSAMTLVHRLRAITVEPDLLGAEFARSHGLHPTDLRPLIADLVGVLSPFAQSELDAVGRVLDAAVETIGRQRPERGGGRPS